MTPPFLHVYGQHAAHDAVHIVGTQEGLLLLLYVLSAPLAGVPSPQQMTIFDAAGNAYELRCTCVPQAADLGNYALPADTRAALREDNPDWPQKMQEEDRGMILSWWWYRLCGPLYRLWLRYANRYVRRYGWLASDCPWCVADNEGVYLQAPHFVQTDGGASVVPGEPTTHWCEGWQTCWRCRYRWWGQESD